MAAMRSALAGHGVRYGKEVRLFWRADLSAHPGRTGPKGPQELKEDPQPQVVLALGLSNLNPAPEIPMT